MSRPTFVTWVNPDAVANIEPAHLQSMLRRVLEKEGEEPVVVICRREVYDSIMAGSWFHFGGRTLEPSESPT